jgi:hypothetical protein
MKRKRITAKKLKIGIAAAFMIFGFSSVSAQQQVSLQEAINRHFRIRQKLKKLLYRSKKPNIRLMRPEPELYLRSVQQ